MHRILFLSLCLMMMFCSQAFAKTTIQQVESKSGIKAWLVEENVSPVIAVHFAFRGGVEQDPEDRQGLASLATALLTQGAGHDRAEVFQKKLADNTITMNFMAGRDSITGSMKFLRDDRGAAISALHAAITKPRFDQDEIDRAKAQMLAAIRMQYGDPGWQARYAMFQAIYAGHPYGQRSLGTDATISAITRHELQDYAKRHFARDNLVVAVAGKITAAETAAMLDKVFATLPEHAQLNDIAETMHTSELPKLHVQRDGTQSNLFFVMAGAKRNDPDWYALDIANYLLGGGGFASRLMHQVREKSGLTYGIATSLSPMQHGGLIVGQASTDNDKAAQAWQMILDVIGQFHKSGVTESELAAAKRYLIGSMPLAFTATDKIAAALVSVQLEHLGIDYLDSYPDLISSVTIEQVNTAIQRWFNPDAIALVAVGQPEGMDFTESRAMVRQ